MGIFDGQTLIDVCMRQYASGEREQRASGRLERGLEVRVRELGECRRPRRRGDVVGIFEFDAAR